jgi:hypothetical protein
MPIFRDLDGNFYDLPADVLAKYRVQGELTDDAKLQGAEVNGPAGIRAPQYFWPPNLPQTPQYFWEPPRQPQYFWDPREQLRAPQYFWDPREQLRPAQYFWDPRVAAPAAAPAAAAAPTVAPAVTEDPATAKEEAMLQKRPGRRRKSK